MNIKISLLRISATLVPCGLKNQHEAPKRTPVLLSDKTPLDTDLKTGTKSVDYLKIYRDGIIRNVLNSKVALFFIAFLPQFIDPALKNTVLPFLALGITFITTGTIWCLILATFASTIYDKL